MLIGISPSGGLIERNPTQAEVVAGLGFLPPTAQQVAGTVEFNPWTAETDSVTSDVIAMTDGQITSITSTVLGAPRVATINRTDGRITSVVTTWGTWTHTETINYDGSGNISSVALSITT